MSRSTRMINDSALAAVALTLAWAAGIRAVEKGRLIFLVAISLSIAITAFGLGARLSSALRRALDVCLALTAVAIGWLQSFPAGNHSSEIGLYLLFGSATLLLALGDASSAPADDAERAIAAR